MSNLEIEIEDTSDHVKKFTVMRKAHYFSRPYIIFVFISVVFSVYHLYKNQDENEWNKKYAWALPVLVFHPFFLFFRGKTLVKESLIVVKDIGIQIEKKYLSGKKAVQFVDISMLKDLIIHEGLTPYNVQYFMGIIIKGSDTLMIPFKEFNLKLEQMKQILLKARSLIRNQQQQ